MPEVKSLFEVAKWMSVEENARVFLKDIRGILSNNPNNFVTIKEMVNKLKWTFEKDAMLMYLLTMPLGLSPEIEILDDKDVSLVAYKYNPNARVGHKVEDWSREKYNEFVTDNVKYCREYKIKRLNKCIREAEERLRNARRNSLKKYTRGPIYDIHDRAATSELYVWFFLDDVYWDILSNNPNRFVTIREIAEKLSGNFEQSEELLYFLCLPVWIFPNIIARENTDYALFAYKYTSDIHRNWSERSIEEWWDDVSSVVRNVAGYFKEWKQETLEEEGKTALRYNPNELY